MKRLFTPMIFVLATFQLAAQGSDFAPLGAKWYYSQPDNIQSTKVIPHTIECTAKEMFQGKWCSKLVSSDVGPVPSPSYVYSQNDTVFFYSTISNQFEMLYDFTAEVGDQWVVGGVYSVDGEGNPLYADTITVDSISILSINGEDMKVWHISDGFYYDWGRRIYQNVGNESMFAPKYAMWELQIWGLRCFETPDTAFHFVAYPCDTIYSTISKTIEPKESDGLEAVPNPFREKITISTASSLSVFSFSMYDQTGRVVRREEHAVGFLEVDTESLPSGIYFWSVDIAGIKVRTGKCVKD